MHMSELEARVNELVRSGFRIILDKLPPHALSKYDSDTTGVVLGLHPEGHYGLFDVTGKVAHVPLLGMATLMENLPRILERHKGYQWTIPYRSFGDNIIGAGLFGYNAESQWKPKILPAKQDPFAKVATGSAAQVSLLSVGWTVTDSQDGWDHMEPPATLRTNPTMVAEGPPPDEEEEEETRLTIRELHLGDFDSLIVTAEDIDSDLVDELRDQIDLAMEDPEHTIIANFDITCTVIRRAEHAYKHLSPVVITHVDDHIIRGETLDHNGQTQIMTWLTAGCFGDRPKVNERFILSTTMYRPNR